MSNVEPLSDEVLNSMLRTNTTDPLRIISREGTIIEFKESYSHSNLPFYFKTMAAFANNKGGYIFFGIKDKPRLLCGLREKSLEMFEGIKIEKVSEDLRNYFSPEIKWESRTFELNGVTLGVIYTYPLDLLQKPCICKKNSNDSKSTLRESDIYYRYSGRSERIRYEELNKIIDESREFEKKEWMELFQRVAKIGVENASLLDLKNGNLTRNGRTVVIDEKLIPKIKFIKRGEFVEEKGQPTLRLIGDVQGIEGRVIYQEKEKEKAIVPAALIEVFLEDRSVEEPTEYIKALCLSQTPNLPIYYFIKRADISVDKAIEIIESSKVSQYNKKKIIERLTGKTIPSKPIAETKTECSRKKAEYSEAWFQENLLWAKEESKLVWQIDAFFSLKDEDIRKKSIYVKSMFLEIYKNKEKFAGNTLSSLRRAICRVDEVLNKQD